MRIILEEIDYSYYIDAVLSEDDVEKLKEGNMLTGETVHKRRKYYVGVRLQGEFDEYGEEEDQQE